VRVDSGVVEGDTIGVNYDPLVAKVIGYAESREAALDRVSAALRRFPILGIRTNLPFLIRLIADPRVRSGATHTGFVDAHEDELTSATEPPAIAVAAAALGDLPGNEAMTSAGAEAPDPWSTLHRWGR
jgi:acetyl/propionyl-CoA carboxylase alpha subunit